MVQAVDTHTQAVPVVLPQQVVQRTIPTIERLVDDAVASRPAAVDLVSNGVQVVDSAGLNWILSILGRLETLQIRLRIVNPSSIFADALMATRLDGRLTIQTSHDGGHSNGRG